MSFVMHRTLMSARLTAIVGIPVALAIMLMTPAAYAENEADTGQGRAVVITVDDLPFVSAATGDDSASGHSLHKIISAIRSNNIPAVGFVNEIRLYTRGVAEPAQVGLLEAWLDVGLELGNHTYSHVSLNRVTSKEFMADLIRGETVTSKLLNTRGSRLTYFRYPFNHLGTDPARRAEVALALQDRGYTVAPITISTKGWVFAMAYDRALRADDPELTRRVVGAYLQHMEASFHYAENLAHGMFGDDIPHIVSLHANRLNAECLKELVSLIAARGYRFISLESALKHRVYRASRTGAGTDGDSHLQRWAQSVGLRPSQGPQVPDFVRQLAGPVAYR